MKTWTEYSKNFEEYYNWISRKNLYNIKMSVLSFNASGLISNIDKFYLYCKDELYKVLINPEQYSIYLILNEKLENRNSKVEHYKKCWKKVASEFDISNLELGEEVGYAYGDNFFYAGIARTSILNIIDVLKIVNAKPNRCVLFISKNNYLNDQCIDINFLEKYLVYNQYGDIDYTNCFAQCYLKHDIGLRYGTSFSEVELALVFGNYESILDMTKINL